MKGSCREDGNQAEQAMDVMAPASCMHKTEQITTFVTKELSSKPHVQQYCKHHFHHVHGYLFSNLKQGTDVSSKDTFKIKIIMQ